jgi:hypothetical protein
VQTPGKPCRVGAVLLVRLCTGRSRCFFPLQRNGLHGPRDAASRRGASARSAPAHHAAGPSSFRMAHRTRARHEGRVPCLRLPFGGRRASVATICNSVATLCNSVATMYNSFATQFGTCGEGKEKGREKGASPAHAGMCARVSAIRPCLIMPSPILPALMREGPIAKPVRERARESARAPNNLPPASSLPSHPPTKMRSKTCFWPPALPHLRLLIPHWTRLRPLPPAHSPKPWTLNSKP